MLGDEKTLTRTRSKGCEAKIDVRTRKLHQPAGDLSDSSSPIEASAHHTGKIIPMLGKFLIGLNAFFDQSLGIRPDFLLISSKNFQLFCFHMIFRIPYRDN